MVDKFRAKNLEPESYPPAEIVDKLNKEINAALVGPKTRRDWPILEARCSAAADFGKLITQETEKWAKVNRGQHIKLWRVQSQFDM